MNKQSIIGIVLVALIFVGFSFYNSKQEQKRQAALTAYNTEQALLQAAQTEAAEAIQEKEAASTEAVSADTLAKPAPRSFTLENEVLKVDFSTQGGQITGVTLKAFNRYAPKGAPKELVRLFDPEAARFDLLPAKTADEVFDLVELQQEADGTHRVVMALGEVRYEYTLYNSGMPERDYLVDFRILGPTSPLTVDWHQHTYQNEKGFQNENTYTTAAWHLPGESTIDDLGMSDKGKSKQVEGSPDWVAFKQQFFSSVLIAPQRFTSASVAYQTAAKGSGYIKEYTAQLALPIAAEHNLAFYFGPNKYALLKDVALSPSAAPQGTTPPAAPDLQLERLVPLGWWIIGWVNRWLVIPVFDLLNHWGLGFGLIILILSILVKLITLPLTYKSYISTAKMRVIKPEVDALNKKYPKQEDAMKRQQATMELYKKAGINPMGGCLPMLIQMPIIIALFRFFPASIELRSQPFLWADDLSAYDSVWDLPFNIPFYGDHVSLFALLMAVALFFFSYINYQQTASSQPQMAGMKVMMVYVMPIMMVLWFNSYASGLTYYYFLANLITIGQTMLIRRMIDDEKIHAILKANTVKNKNKKKSNFQQRYEEMLKAAQAQQAAGRKK